MSADVLTPIVDDAPPQPAGRSVGSRLWRWGWPKLIAIALALLAIAGLVAGLAAVLGRPGIPLGAILVLLVANPLSAAAVPVEFLVAPWGAIGQWLPPGAGATLLRDVAYFPAADASFPWLVLAGWAAVGLILVALGRMRDVRRPADAGAAPAS